MTQRRIVVDMSSKAINARLREVAQLRKLGLSIAKAKQIQTVESNTSETTVALNKPIERAVRAAHRQK